MPTSETREVGERTENGGGVLEDTGNSVLACWGLWAICCIIILTWKKMASGLESQGLNHFISKRKFIHYTRKTLGSESYMGKK